MKKIGMFVVIGMLAIVGFAPIKRCEPDAEAATSQKQEPNTIAGCDDCGKCRSDQYCCKTANGCVGCFPTACP